MLPRVPYCLYWLAGQVGARLRPGDYLQYVGDSTFLMMLMMLAGDGVNGFGS